MMTDHLPECPLHKGCQCPWIAECADCACICPELRASQHRGFMLGWGEGHHVGYGHGLDAAEAAVAACGSDKGYVYSDTETGIEWAVAAIRALKEKP